MLDQTVLNVALDLTVGTQGIPKGKVVRPAFQMSIDLANEHRNRLETLMTIGHFVQLFLFPLDCLLRQKHIQILSIASSPITVVPKRLPQKVQTLPLFPQVDQPPLFPVDLQLELAYQSRFDE